MKTLLLAISTFIERIRYRQTFNRLDCIKGLNPAKHDRVFESYFADHMRKKRA